MYEWFDDSGMALLAELGGCIDGPTVLCRETLLESGREGLEARRICAGKGGGGMDGRIPVRPLRFRSEGLESIGGLCPPLRDECVVLGVVGGGRAEDDGVDATLKELGRSARIGVEAGVR